MRRPPAVLKGEQKKAVLENADRAVGLCCWRLCGGCSLFFVLPLKISLLSSASEQGLGRLVGYLRMLQPQRAVRSSVPVRLLSRVQNCYLSCAGL